MAQTLIDQSMVSGLVADLGGKADAASTGIKSAAAVASTSGTAINFGSIPAGVKRITVAMSGVSVSGTAALLLQLGTSAGILSSGYGAYGGQGGSSTWGGASYTAGFGINNANAARLISGIITLVNVTGNVWVMSAVLGDGSTTSGWFTAGNVSLPGILDRIRITTSNGTDTFDAGQINVHWEF